MKPEIQLIVGKTINSINSGTNPAGGVMDDGNTHSVEARRPCLTRRPKAGK